MRKIMYTVFMLLVLMMGVGAGILIGYHYNDAADAVTAQQLSGAQQSINELQSANQQANASISSLKDAASFASSVSAASSAQPKLSNPELAMAAYLDINGTTPDVNLQRFGAGAGLNFNTAPDGTISIDAGNPESKVVFHINGDTVNEGPDPATPTPGAIQPTTASVNDLNQRYVPFISQLDAVIASASNPNKGQ